MCPTSFERAYSTCAGCFLEKQEESQIHAPSSPGVGQVGQPHQHGIVAGTMGGIGWSTGRDSGTTAGPEGRNHTRRTTWQDTGTSERSKGEGPAWSAARPETASARHGCGRRHPADRGTGTTRQGRSGAGWTGNGRCPSRSMRTVAVLMGGGEPMRCERDRLHEEG